MTLIPDTFSIIPALPSISVSSVAKYLVCSASCLAYIRCRRSDDANLSLGENCSALANL